VADTTWVIVFTIAFSVVTAMTFCWDERLTAAAEPKPPRTRTDPRMIQSVRRREPEEAGRGAADEEEEEAMRKKSGNEERSRKEENVC
jgi:hypothetical protein